MQYNEKSEGMNIVLVILMNWLEYQYSVFG